MLEGVVRSAQSVNRLLLGLVLGAALGSACAQGDAKRGEYLAKVGGCIGCNRDRRQVTRVRTDRRSVAQQSTTSTPPIFPTFDPPYAAESVLRISRYRPELGTPIRNRLRSTGEKLQTQMIRRPLDGAIRMNAIRLLAASSASIHRKPEGSVSASHSAGSSR